VGALMADLRERDDRENRLSTWVLRELFAALPSPLHALHIFCYHTGVRRDEQGRMVPVRSTRTGQAIGERRQSWLNRPKSDWQGRHPSGITRAIEKAVSR